MFISNFLPFIFINPELEILRTKLDSRMSYGLMLMVVRFSSLIIVMTGENLGFTKDGQKITTKIMFTLQRTKLNFILTI